MLDTENYTNQSQQICSAQIEKPEPASYLLGLLGAVLGAVVGTVPWFLASTFASLYIGWLGFLVGIAALFGYKLFHGAKKTVYATVVIYLTSLVAVCLAFFLSNMYNLFKDAEFAQAVSYYGLSKLEATWIVLTDSENTAIVLKDLGISLVIAVLGLLTTKNSIRKYTAPETLCSDDKTVQSSEAALSGTYESGLRLPFTFTVSEKKGEFVGGIVTAAFFGLLMIGSIVFFAIEYDSEMIFPIVVFTALFLLGMFLVLKSKLRKLTITGENIVYTNSFGRSTEFTTGEIGFIKKPNASCISIFKKDGSLIAKTEVSMQNYPLWVQYLSEHRVELRG